MRTLYGFILSFILIQSLHAQEIEPSSFISPDKDYLYYLENIQEYNTPTNKFGLIPVPFKPDFSNFDVQRLFPLKSSATIPFSYDLRTIGYLTSVKDQGGGQFGGNCWTFAALGAIESQWKKMGLGSFNLAEQNLATCHGLGGEFGSGGNHFYIMAYFSLLKGPVHEWQHPYNIYDTASFACKDSLTRVSLVPEIRMLPPRNDFVIKKILMDYGAIYTSMRWDNSSWDGASNYTYLYSGDKAVNHAVLLVGWDDNMETPAGKGAWIIKNQWNTTFADTGYFYISYQDSKINSDLVFFPTRLNNNKIDKIYYYDDLCATSQYGGLKSEKSYVLSKFNGNAGDVINRIGTFLNTASSIVDIEIYAKKSGDTLSQLLSSKHDVYCELPGYYSFEIPQFKVSGDFFVKLAYNTPGNKFNIPIENITSTMRADTTLNRPTLQTAENNMNKKTEYKFRSTKTKPRATMQYPSNNATQVPLDALVAIKLNEQVDSIDFSKITLKDTSNNSVSGFSVKFDSISRLLTLMHNALDTNKVYTVVIPDSSFRNNLSAYNDSITWTFSTTKNTDAPSIYMPFKKKQVSQNAYVELMFNKPLILSDPSKISIADENNTTLASPTISLSSSKTILKISHASITANKKYTVQVLSGAVRSETGNISNQDTSYIFNKTDEPLFRHLYPAEKSQIHPGNKTFKTYCTQTIDSISPEKIMIRHKSWSPITEYSSLAEFIDKDSLNCVNILCDKVAYSDTLFIVFQANSLFNEYGISNSKSMYWTVYTVKDGTPALASSTPSEFAEGFSDSLITLVFTEKVLKNQFDSIRITSNKGKSIPVKSVTLGSDNKTLSITIAKDSIEASTLYTLSLSDSIVKTTGYNWISNNAKNWLPVGKGRDVEEFDLCVRAYADTSNIPIPDFTASRTVSCKNSPITFTDNSFDSISSYSWNFGNSASPSTATGKGPHTVTYPDNGYYTIKLKVQGPNGTDSIEKYNFINITPDINVYIPEPRIEIPLGKSDTIKAYGADEYIWLPAYNLDTNKGSMVVYTPPELGSHTYYVWGSIGTCSNFDSVIIDVTLRPSNDSVCSALLVQLGKNGPYSNVYATVEDNEPHPENLQLPNDAGCYTQYSWCYEFYDPDALANTLWFKFVAPSSGKISIATDDRYGTGKQFDTQIGLYRTAACNELLNGNYKIIAANDDFYGYDKSFASAIQLIDTLTPGNIYYIQVDGSAGGATGEFYLTLSEDMLLNDFGLADTQEKLFLYPNPATNNLNIYYKDIENPTDLNIQILDVNGKIVLSRQVKNALGYYKTSMNIDGLPKGTYIFSITENSGHYTKLLIVQ